MRTLLKNINLFRGVAWALFLAYFTVAVRKVGPVLMRVPVVIGLLWFGTLFTPVPASLFSFNMVWAILVLSMLFAFSDQVFKTGWTWVEWRLTAYITTVTDKNRTRINAEPVNAEDANPAD